VPDVGISLNAEVPRMTKTRGRPQGTDLHTMIPTHADVPAEQMKLRSAGAQPHELTETEAEELIARARAGRRVKVYLDATTFIQTDAPNRNLTRFRKGALGKLAKSFVGVPFLRDHQQENTLARGGKIVASELVTENDGVAAFRMTIELTEPWAVEAALRGSIDRFSIAWCSTGDLSCSICGEPLALGWFSVESSCEHELGQEYEGVTCQLEFSDAEGVEVSTVSVPAVRGTELEGIRASLARSRGLAPQPLAKPAVPPPAAATKTPPLPPLTRLCVELGIAADGNADAVLAAVAALRRAAAAELEAHAATRAQLVAREEQELTQAIEREIERGVAEGRFAMKRDRNGDRVESAVERSIRRLGKTGGLDAAREYVNDLTPSMTAPLGRGLQSIGEDPTPRGEPLSDEQVHVNKLLGVDNVAVARELANRKVRQP
jgi:hypothetical protein